jgi:serine kinase of HPr protein (carbohydrate metabolism regulator)
VIAHAGLVAQWIDGRWRGALIEGPSGCGKSDLALRLIEAGWRLVADDRVLLWRARGRLYGRPPDPLRGLIEVRGLGVIAAPSVALAEVAMVVRPGAPERLPDRQAAERLGVTLPQLTLPYCEASAPAKLRRALAALYLAGERRM